MSYGNLVRRPFEIVARRPYLWLLGFLAGGGAAANFGSSGTSYTQPAPTGTYVGPTWTTIQAVWNENATWIAWTAAILVIACLVMFVLGCIATGGIVHAAIEHDEGRDYKLGTAWRAGYATGWRIAGVRVLTLLLALAPGLLIAALALAAAVQALSASTAAAIAYGLFAAAAFVISVAWWVVLGAAGELAQRRIVLDQGHVAESLSAGFRMIRWHFKEVALGWLILAGISIAAGILLALVAAIVAIPAAAIGFGGWAVGGTTGLIVAGSFAGVFLVGIVVAAGAAYAAYSSVYWTLLYRSVRSLPAPVTRGAPVPA